MAVHRMDRINRLLTMHLADVVHQHWHNGTMDRSGQLITVQRVVASRDLSQAKVFISTTGVEAASHGDAVSVLQRHAGVLAGSLSHRVRLRRLPRLQFVADPWGDEIARVDELMRSLEISSPSDG